MRDNYIKAVSAMIQRRMEPKIKKEFQKLEERIKSKRIMAKYKIMVSAFEEHKEILLYEQPDIDIITPWQWLRENFPLFNWEPILNDSEDFIQYEAEAVNTDNDDEGGNPHTTMLVSFIQESKIRE